MTDAPLQAFTGPGPLFAILPNIPPAGTLVAWALYAVFAYWAFYTIVAVYHWLKYSHASWLAFPAIAAHLVISFMLASYALSGNTYFLTTYLP